MGRPSWGRWEEALMLRPLCPLQVKLADGDVTSKRPWKTTNQARLLPPLYGGTPFASSPFFLLAAAAAPRAVTGVDPHPRLARCSPSARWWRTRLAWPTRGSPRTWHPPCTNISGDERRAEELVGSAAAAVVGRRRLRRGPLGSAPRAWTMQTRSALRRLVVDGGAASCSEGS